MFTFTEIIEALRTELHRQDENAQTTYHEGREYLLLDDNMLCLDDLATAVMVTAAHRQP